MQRTTDTALSSIRGFRALIAVVITT